MDQKRAMLYPEIDTTNNALLQHQRMSASAAIGLPTEAPPSYDAAMGTTSTSSKAASSGAGGWRPSAPVTAPDMSTIVHPHSPPPLSPRERQSQQHDEAPAPAHTRPVIVVQPQPQPQPQLYDPHADVAPLPTATSALPPKLGPNPCAVVCPACGANKTTRMYYTPNTRTHLCALLLCLVGWCCCACTVPYCMNSCRTGNHYCAKCNTFLGVYDPRKHR